MLIDLITELKKPDIDPLVSLGRVSYDPAFTKEEVVELSNTSSFQKIRTFGSIFLDTDPKGYRCHVGAMGENSHLNCYGESIRTAIKHADYVLSGDIRLTFCTPNPTPCIFKISRIAQEKSGDVSNTEHDLWLKLREFGSISIDWDTHYAGPGVYENPYPMFFCHYSNEVFALSTYGNTIEKALVRCMKIVKMEKAFVD